MDITIQAMHFDASVQLREFTEKRITKLDRLTDLIVNAEVILKVTKPEVANNKDASIKLNIKSGELFANKTADSFEEAIVLCAEALERQIKKTKDKTQSK